jgi:hypothetical protein
MTTITLNSQDRTQASRPGVATALQELTVAARHLGAALLSALQRDRAAARPLTVFEEAENLRAYARGFERTDRGFASDLYAAADRHERGQGA